MLNKNVENLHIVACFRLHIIGKKLEDSLVSKSWTAYTLEECLHFCISELTFQCQGFSYRLELPNVYFVTRKKMYSRYKHADLKYNLSFPLL